MRMHVLPMLLSLSLPVLAAFPALAAQPPPPEEALRQYRQAEDGFDLPLLRQVLDPHFVEISPLGQVDEHDAVLSYYAPEKKVAAPPMTLDQIEVRTSGTAATISARLRYAMAGHDMALRVGATARETPQGWILLSAQYTPIPPAAPPATP